MIKNISLEEIYLKSSVRVIDIYCKFEINMYGATSK